jgi:hypothetical protein
LGQFSGRKPSGLSPQRALFKFREALDVLIMTSPSRVFEEARPDFGPFGTECGNLMSYYVYE